MFPFAFVQLRELVQLLFTKFTLARHLLRWLMAGNYQQPYNVFQVSQKWNMLPMSWLRAEVFTQNKTWGRLLIFTDSQKSFTSRVASISSIYLTGRHWSNTKLAARNIGPFQFFSKQGAFASKLKRVQDSTMSTLLFIVVWC